MLGEAMEHAFRPEVEVHLGTRREGTQQRLQSVKLFANAGLEQAQ